MDVNTERVIEGAVTGAAAGLVASWVMSEFHEAWKAASGDRDVGDEPNTGGRRCNGSYRRETGTGGIS